MPRLACELSHPLTVIAIAVLVINDHVLKGAGLLPPWLTGKLSDFAGLFFFPVLLFTLVDGVRRALGLRAFDRRRVALVAACATGAVFTGIKLHAGVRAAFSFAGIFAPDPGDLVALPMVVAAYLWIAVRDWSAPRRAVLWPAWRTAIVVAAAAASVGTGSTTMLRGYPAWELSRNETLSVGCAWAHAWVSKSGKQGVGVTLEFMPVAEPACTVRVLRARVEIAGQPVQVASLPDPVVFGPARGYAYLAFPFDNEAAWNREELVGDLSVWLAAGGEVRLLRRRMHHRWRGPHVSRFEPEPKLHFLEPAPADPAGDAGDAGVPRGSTP